MATGTLKSFSRDDAFGFILPDDESQEVYVTLLAFQRANIEPTIGMHLSFRLDTVSKMGKLIAAGLQKI